MRAHSLAVPKSGLGLVSTISPDAQSGNLLAFNPADSTFSTIGEDEFSTGVVRPSSDNSAVVAAETYSLPGSIALWTEAVPDVRVGSGHSVNTTELEDIAVAPGASAIAAFDYDAIAFFDEELDPMKSVELPFDVENGDGILIPEDGDYEAAIAFGDQGRRVLVTYQAAPASARILVIDATELKLMGVELDLPLSGEGHISQAHLLSKAGFLFAAYATAGGRSVIYKIPLAEIE